MRQVALALALLLPAAAARAQTDDGTAALLAGSGPGACVLALDVDAVLDVERLPLEGFVLATLLARVTGARPGPQTADPEECRPADYPTGAMEVRVHVPARRDLRWLAPASIEVVADPIPGREPGDGPGVVIAYLRTL